MKLAVMWSTPNCRFCDMALKTLTSKGYTVEVKKIGSNVTKEEFFEAMPTGTRTVPQIFINGVHIGGYNELIENDQI